MVREKGQTVTEFIVMMAALTAIGVMISKQMIGPQFNPQDLRTGAIGAAQDSTGQCNSGGPKSATVCIARDDD